LDRGFAAARIPHPLRGWYRADRFGGGRVLALSTWGPLVAAVVMTRSHTFGLSLPREMFIATGQGVAQPGRVQAYPQGDRGCGRRRGRLGGGRGAFGGFVTPPIGRHFVAAAGGIG